MINSIFRTEKKTERETERQREADRETEKGRQRDRERERITTTTRSVVVSNLNTSFDRYLMAKI
jgi:hypothetical protein